MDTTHLPTPVPPLIARRQWNAQDQHVFIDNKMKAERQQFMVMTIDIVLLNLSLWGFIVSQIPLPKLTTDYLMPVIAFFLLANIIGFIGVPFTEIYRISEGIKLNLKIKALFWGSLIYFGILSLIYYPFFFPNLQIHFLLPAFITFFGLSTVTHFAFRYYNKQHPILLTYAVIGGKSGSLKYLNHVFESVYGKDTVCVGRFADDEVSGIDSLGSYWSIEAYLKNNITPINKLIYFYSDLSKTEIRRIVQLCRSSFVDFEVVPIGIDFFEKGLQMEQLEHLPIFRRGKEPLCQVENKVLKRAFDILFAVSVIVFVFPWLFPIIALLIKLESKGPIFFLQTRTGYWNKPFKCLKFRTMQVNAQSDQEQATKHDARITKVGAFLRKANLDELPQFINVLLGDMSVVGPRPHMLQHTMAYAKLIDQFMIRHEVKPGITGWAQVNGFRGPTEELNQMARRVEYDVHYIENWNFWFDCKCVFLTAFNMANGEENAF